MKEDKTVPQLRFPEFTDAWKQRKLSESAKFSKGNGYSKSDVTTKGIPLVLYGRLYTNYETVISNIDTYSELENEGSVVSKGGEIIVPASGETAEDISRASVIKDSGVLIGGDLNIICPSNDIIPSFLALTITYGNVHKEMTKLAQGKTVVHLHNSDLYKIRFFVPSYNEQLRITALFSNIESTITLQQRKLNSLQKLKKGLFQKMFPKNGENIPEIRFPEFSDAWKQRKFGDVLVSIQTGTNKLGSDRNSGQPLLKMGNLQSGYFDLSKLEFLENKAEPENIVKQGDFFFNTRNTLELVGKGATWFGESNKYAFNSNIARFTLKDINTGFFNYLYNTNYVKKQIRARAMGTTSVAAIYPRSLKSVDIVIPNMEEQIKLSNLFMNLDSTITLQQRKLEFLQKLKKGLLQQMFI